MKLKKIPRQCYLENKSIICDISGRPSLKDTKHLQVINLSPPPPQEQDLFLQITEHCERHGKDTQ